MRRALRPRRPRHDGDPRTRLRILLLPTLALVLSGCSSATPTGPDLAGAGPRPTARVPHLRPCPAAGARTALPDLVLRCLTGTSQVRLSQVVHDRPVLVNLWASWCVPCQSEMPALQRSFAAYGKQLDFLGVNSLDERDSALDFLAALDVRFPQVFDAPGDALHRVGGSGLPLTLVLGRDGRQLYAHRGQLRMPDLRDALVAAGVARPDVAALLRPGEHM